MRTSWGRPIAISQRCMISERSRHVACCMASRAAMRRGEPRRRVRGVGQPGAGVDALACPGPCARPPGPCPATRTPPGGSGATPAQTARRSVRKARSARPAAYHVCSRDLILACDAHGSPDHHPRDARSDASPAPMDKPARGEFRLDEALAPPRRRRLRDLPGLMLGAVALVWRAARRELLITAGLQFVSSVGLGAQLLVSRSLLEHILAGHQRRLRRRRARHRDPRGDHRHRRRSATPRAARSSARSASWWRATRPPA